MQQNVFDEKLYTSTEVAEILGVSLRSIYRYLEENKLQAAVKTATGRHRFTRQNINDFLHPSDKSTQPDKTSAPAFGADNRVDNMKDNEDILHGKTDRLGTRSEMYYKSDQDGDEMEEDTLSKQAKKQSGFADGDMIRDDTSDDRKEGVPVGQVEVKDEPVDWLARFRQAAEKYKAQATKIAEEPFDEYKSKAVKVEDEPKEGPKDKSRITKEEVYEEGVFNYYRSGVGGLKEIAQSLDKSAKNASLDYAFTMNAGLSLHKPIKPFSLIHAYVRKSDLPYFEKVLQLTPSQKDTAQLCLITSDDDSVYANRKELHGLYVVSDSRIKSDLLAEGEVELAGELE